MADESAINQYLTFTLSEEVFALDIASVREVLEYTTITRVPGSPPEMRGVINLRGKAVPVMDLRCKFGLPEVDRTVNTCIIIIEATLEGERIAVGALVDSVREVLEMSAEHIQPTPRMGLQMNAKFIKGMGRPGDQFVIILDGDQVFSAEELSAIKDAGDPDARAA